MNEYTILGYTILAGLLSIIYGFITGKNILNSSAGNANARNCICNSGWRYLNRQYKTIAIVEVGVVIISYA